MREYVNELVESYRIMSSTYTNDCHKAAVVLENTIIRLALSFYEMPDWAREAAINSITTKEEVYEIIDELLERKELT